MGGTRFEYKNIKNWIPVNEKFFPFFLNGNFSKNKKKKKKKTNRKKKIWFLEKKGV